MTWFPCRACAAKDAELARLTERAANAEGVANRLLAERDRLTIELVNLARETRALPPVSILPPPPPPPPPVPLDPAVELFLDAKFVNGTPLWRQQVREARKLAAAKMTPEKIINTLATGQQVEC